MKIGMIGAGKVGFSLGRLFSDSYAAGKTDIQVTGYYSQNPDSAREAAAFTHSEYYDDIKKLADDSGAIFITVPDKEVTAVYLQLCQYEIQNKFICHCSGVLSSQEAFPKIEEAGAYGFSIHPLFPVNSKYESYKELKDAFFCLEGNRQFMPVIEKMMQGLGLKFQQIPAEAKIRYHAACAGASNLMCALVQESIDLLVSCGFSPRQAVQALSPLMRSNLEHIIQDGPVQALTGAVERGDGTTVEKHLQCFTGQQDKEIYRLLSLKLTELASVKHPGKSYEPIRALLSGERKENE